MKEKRERLQDGARREMREMMSEQGGEWRVRGLEGKGAMGRGGGGGSGGATAERFAREGAKVVVADIFLERAQDVVGKIGKNAHAVYLDGGDEKSVEEMVKETIARFGRVDVRSEEHTSELQSLMRISYAVFCLTKKIKTGINSCGQDFKSALVRHTNM